jgi:hypothetical protein
VAALVIVSLLAMWQRSHYDSWVSGHDIFSFHLPWFAYLGQRLREFQIPAWNPYVNSGAPMAGDPQSGWMLAQAMLAFTLFPNPVVAFKAMATLELLIGGLATYAFARTLKLSPLSALFSAIVFAFGPLFYHVTAATCCAVRGFMSPWIPVALLGVELALAPEPWRRRLLPICLAGFGMSQFYASFLGQGALDAMLLLGAYVAYRAFVSPPSPRRALERIATGVGVGLGSAGFSLMLGAAGLFPRLSFLSKSEVANGYEGVTDIYRGYIPNVPNLLFTLLSDRPGEGFLSIGGIGVLFFIFGVLLSWRRHCVPFFAIFTVVSLVLAMGDTPLHELFYLIPRFKDLHVHYPEQETAILMIGPAIVAGAGFEAVLNLRRRRLWLLLALAPIAVVTGVYIYLETGKYPMTGVTSIIAAGLAAVVVVLMTALSPNLSGAWRSVKRAGPAVIVALAFILPTGVQLLIPMTNISPGSGWETVMTVNPQGSAALKKVARSTDPGEAGEFLQQQLAISGPFRYTGYASWRYGPPHFKWDYDYPIFRLQPNVLGILTNGRSMFLHIYDTQVYNPVQYARYHAFIEAINGINQDYHFSDLNEAGLDSKLYVLLNARYVLLDKTIPLSRSDAVKIMANRHVVYEDPYVRVLESDGPQPSAAWIVHEVDLQPYGNVLATMKAPSFDPRTMAVTEQANPGIQRLMPGATESATVTSYKPESITISTNAASNGLLVVSENYDPDWKAYVDGKRVPTQPVDFAFRGVPLTAGSHTVELRYEPSSLRFGLWLTGLALVAWTGIAVWRLVDRRAPRRRLSE